MAICTTYPWILQNNLSRCNNSFSAKCTLDCPREMCKMYWSNGTLCYNLKERPCEEALVEVVEGASSPVAGTPTDCIRASCCLPRSNCHLASIGHTQVTGSRGMPCASTSCRQRRSTRSAERASHDTPTSHRGSKCHRAMPPPREGRHIFAPVVTTTRLGLFHLLVVSRLASTRLIFSRSLSDLHW